MPRQARLDAPGVLQHVMARGIERRKIFWDDKDRTAFLERFGVILEDTQTQCYAWALIPNHFHILLRTGTTPLSKVMRRLMTGYAVTFNLRHRRAGHLFQNRYKSVVCEEDPYLLELIRYIHLNPLRAKIVADLKALDKYAWTGHSVLLGKQKNPLISDTVPINNNEKLLAEVTIEDVLKHFGKRLKDARQNYHHFVEKGIKQGRRPELQGGGLVRSAGGDTSVLSPKRKEDRELSDERILGSGDFVSGVMKKANELMDDRARFSISLQDLASKVCSRFEITFDELTSRRRKRNLSQARAVFCYLAVDQLGYSGENMVRTLKISGRGVSDCRDRGKKILDNPEIISEYLT
jgi:REP element-mobilizing transposase RayT